MTIAIALCTTSSISTVKRFELEAGKFWTAAAAVITTCVGLTLADIFFSDRILQTFGSETVTAANGTHTQLRNTEDSSRRDFDLWRVCRFEKETNVPGLEERQQSGTPCQISSSLVGCHQRNLVRCISH